MTIVANGDSFNYDRGQVKSTAELVGAVPVNSEGDILEGITTLTPLGYAQDTTISAASALPTVPAATTVVLIQVEGQNCRWRDDGVDPTASIGVLLGAGTAFWYRGTFAAFKIIEVAASATLNVSFYQEVAA
jgi:hypothetical protein